MNIKVLGLDTASSAVSAAVVVGGQLLGEFSVRRPRRASALFPKIPDALLAALDLSVQEIEVIALTVGPGSFTGLRIAYSLAVGAGLAGDKRLVGINSLQALVAGINLPGEYYAIGALPARGGAVFASLYRCKDRSGKIPDGGGMQFSEPVEVIRPARRSAAEMLTVAGEHVIGDSPVVWIDDGNVEVEESMRKYYSADVRFLSTSIRPGAVAHLGWVAAGEGALKRLSDIDLRYFRASAAERAQEEAG